MPIDEKFSLASFISKGIGTEEIEQLSRDLEEEIQSEFHNLLLDNAEKIIQKLNTKGNKLKQYYEPQPGDISYRDDETYQGEYICRLRIGIDTMISVGFGDTVDEIDSIEE